MILSPASLALLLLLLPLLLQMKQYRRDIAELLRAGKQDYARIRVEAVIREAFTLTGTPRVRWVCYLITVVSRGCRGMLGMLGGIHPHRYAAAAAMQLSACPAVDCCWLQ
jgi:hypothetical protein